MYGNPFMLKVCGSGILQTDAVRGFLTMRLIIFMFKIVAGLIVSMGKLLGGAGLLVASASSKVYDEKRQQNTDKIERK